ncbi:MAG: DNA replication and repair protein RecF [Candidatus Saccharibacteria bacterium]|nr:DNA replication and repair protein RecF [Candidatus Saccharibacteria bacterium]
MIHDLRLQHFRSYDDDTFEFGAGVNIVVGPNASGKTNLLEAILVLSKGSSYRAGLRELVAFEQPWARLESHGEQDNRVLKIDCRQALPQKSFVIDTKTYTRLPYAKTLPTVLFEPTHLRLLSGSPESRRDFLDDLLEQTTPGFGTTRRAYKRTLAQRNNLLKKLSYGQTSELFAWNIRLSELGGQIFEKRRELIGNLVGEVDELYKKLSVSDKRVEIVYRASCPESQYSTQLLHRLEASMEDDIVRGYTSYGPHREDFVLLFDSRPAAEVASRGEVRTAMLSLKIAELGLIESVRGLKPILLLDDVFSELDGARRQALTNYLTNYQSFITTTDADVVLQHFIDNCTIIPMSN